jgi:hypothetical protein
MPAHDQRRYQGYEAEDLIHRHGRARGEADQNDKYRQPELAAAQTDQAADTADQQGTAEGNCDRAPGCEGGRNGRGNQTHHTPARALWQIGYSARASLWQLRYSGAFRFSGRRPDERAARAPPNHRPP